MRLDVESTICAIATGAIGAPRGAIRITGPNAIAIAQRAFAQQVYQTSSEQLTNPSDPWASKRAVRFKGIVELGLLGSIPVSVYLWPDSRSYTGQPSVEFHCLGNIVVLQQLQSKLTQVGAQLAEPGEFTLRAFLAGRLDLSQCEAVLGVIHAANERSLHVALKQLAGGLSGPLSEVRTSLIHLLADIEAGLDFVDEDIEFISKEQILVRLVAAQTCITNLLGQIDSRGGQSFQLQVAIAGLPNAGKSSLLNAIAREQVAIVSDIPGTTRDYVSVRLDLDGVQVDLLDTAGLEEADETTPRGIAQQKTRDQIQKADLVLECRSPAEERSSAGPLGSHAAISQGECWTVKTKCDLETIGEKEMHHDKLNVDRPNRCYLTSCLQQESIHGLVLALSAWAKDRYEQVSQVVPMTSIRCRGSLERVQESIGTAVEAVEFGRGDEIVASELRLALDEIGVVTGTVYNDDILDALFSRFCIGK